jgi:ribose transport system permease protein
MAIGSVLLIGLVLGLIHGLLITKVELQPFVVTLCGLLVYRGVARWLTGDQVQGFKTEYADSIQRLAVGKMSLGFTSHGEVIGIPYPFFILIITGVLASIFLNKTIWGRYMQAVGHNEAAARYSGINTHRVTIVAYVICAVLACVGGMLFALSNNSVSPSAFGNFFELYAIAAAVLGGCSLRGGEGGILGVVIGTAVMQTLKNSILLLGISDTLEFVIVGLVLLAGVIADQYIKRIIDRRRLATRGERARA